MTETALAGRIVAVTGGAGGIGREIASRFAAAGARVAIGDSDADAAAAAARALPGQVRGFALEVTDTGSFRRFLGAVEELWGPLDVLVTDAGLAFGNERAGGRTIAVNLHGVIVGVQLVAPGMRARGGGHIVTVATATAVGESLCAATKHGVLGYLGGVREQLRGSGVAVSALMSGVAGSPLEGGTDHPACVAAAVVDLVAAHLPSGTPARALRDSPDRSDPVTPDRIAMPGTDDSPVARRALDSVARAADGSQPRAQPAVHREHGAGDVGRAVAE
ncbi:SDR family NAD(P)-dependent oxidoreductase [Nocardia sp. NPDC057227]|uniref:SDR family NAD(P)-dependent oxidoreductase n=1 Tax=Nocardia sp. NPDC057227 TaxID=3346056 RepID=UPI0036389102